MSDYTKYSSETQSIAAALFEGGWRKEDKEQLMQEYGLTDEQADVICELLAEMEG